MCKPDEKNTSYVTAELLDELNGILEEEAEEKALFDDFSEELEKSAPVMVKVDETEDTAAVEREIYLKERRKYPGVGLPDSVEPLE